MLKIDLPRHARLIRNSAFNFGGHAVNVLAALACIPIAFRHLGAERFGLLTLVWSMLSYAIVFDLGTGPAVARGTASSLVRDGGRRIRAIVNAGMTIQIILGFSIAVLLVILGPWLVSLLKVPALWQGDARAALDLLALALPIVLLSQSQQGALEGLERFDLLAYVRAPAAAATYVIPAVGALANWSLAHITLGLCAVRLCALIALYVMWRRSLPAGQDGRAREELPGLFRYSRWLALSGALTQMLVYVDRFLLSGLQGLNAVAQYSAPYDATSKMLLLPGSVGVALFPTLAKDAALQRNEDAIARARAGALMTMSLLLPAGLLLMLFAGPLLHLWLGPQLTDQGVQAFRILILANLLHAAAYPPVILVEAYGRSAAVARFYLGALLLYLPVLVLGIRYYGVAGAAWAWVAYTATLMLWSTWYARRLVRTVTLPPVSQFANAD